jgi:hypothetical protein
MEQQIYVPWKMDLCFDYPPAAPPSRRRGLEREVWGKRHHVHDPGWGIGVETDDIEDEVNFTDV